MDYMCAMTVRISTSLIKQLQYQARQAHPLECCGLLLGGKADLLDQFIPARNVASEPEKHFEIDPVILIAAERTARTTGPEIFGYYHSHPNGVAMPSPTDAAMAAHDGRHWLILAGDDVTLWHNVRGGALHDAFEEVPFSVVA
jgi:proteasome lid subunit RPN8/RPN11